MVTSTPTRRATTKRPIPSGDAASIILLLSEHESNLDYLFAIAAHFGHNGPEL